MLRWLYIQLIWLHPAPFRCRFGYDMLDDFDRSDLRARLRYFADVIASLARQWLFRPEFRPGSLPLIADASWKRLGVPLFHTIETYKPHPAALLHGGLLAIVSISLAVQVIEKGDAFRMPFLIGAHFSRSGLFAVDRKSMTGDDLNTALRLGPDPLEAWLKLGRPYFMSMPVLVALDADRDLTLSPWGDQQRPGGSSQTGH